MSDNAVPKAAPGQLRRIYSVILSAAWTVAKGRSMVIGVLMVLQGMLGAATAFLTKLVVDALTQGQSSRAFFWGAVFVTQAVATTMSQGLMELVQYDLSDKVSQEMDQRLMAVAAGAPGLDHLERPEYADKVKIVRQFAGLPFSAIANLGSLIYMVFGLATALVLLGRIHAALLLMPLIALPTAILQFRSQRKHYRRWDETAPEERLTQHYMQLATGPLAAKEVRLFALGDELVKRHAEVSRGWIRKLYRDRLKRSGVGIVTGAIYGASIAGAVAFIGWLALRGRATTGDVAQGVQVARMIVGHVQMAASTVAWLAQLTFYGERYVWLLDYEPQVQVAPRGTAAAAPAVIREGITFEDVGLVYPGTDKQVLTGVSFHIPPGATVALVGENGAGKTSLVKLLARFYDPTRGRILVDGTDLREIDLDEWRNGLAAAFQDFVRFQLTAKEVIGIGDLSRMDDMEQVTTAADYARVQSVIDKLPRGYDTQLGRWFEDGIDCSEGEWQRLALARGSMRRYPALAILDEPTASLDARAEHEVFERYMHMARPVGAPPPITILVSHRFSTVRMSDLIVVVHEGQVSEIGSHQALIARGDRYAELFGLQASRYD